MGTIGIVTVLYVLAAISLVGMVPYNEISATSGFPDGFRYRGIEWASQISAVSFPFLAAQRCNIESLYYKQAKSHLSM